MICLVPESAKRIPAIKKAANRNVQRPFSTHSNIKLPRGSMDSKCVNDYVLKKKPRHQKEENLAGIIP